MFVILKNAKFDGLSKIFSVVSTNISIKFESFSTIYKKKSNFNNIFREVSIYKILNAFLSSFIVDTIEMNKVDEMNFSYKYQGTHCMIHCNFAKKKSLKCPFFKTVGRFQFYAYIHGNYGKKFRKFMDSVKLQFSI